MKTAEKTVSDRASGAIAGQPGFAFLHIVVAAYDRAKLIAEQALGPWFLGFAARLLFLAVLGAYYYQSALTKSGMGVLGVFMPSAGAFYQILPGLTEHYSYDTSAIPFFPWHLIVIAGTLTEFTLPILIVAGAFTRLASLAMIGFITVQTIVDIYAHGAAAGMLFNNQPGELIDMRLLWIFPLVYLVINGAGKVALDPVLRRAFGARGR